MDYLELRMALGSTASEEDWRFCLQLIDRIVLSQEWDEDELAMWARKRARYDELASN